MTIGIIGRVADGAEMCDGQTVTTRMMRAELQKRLHMPVYCVDTYKHKQRFPVCLLRSFICLCKCKYIFIMLARNGCRFYFPFLYYSNKLFRRKIYHRVIGGSVGKYAATCYPKWIKYLNAFEINFVESKTQVKQFKDLGITNAVETFTFRNAEITAPNDFPEYRHPPYRFCTFCRVTKEKGISDAIRAVIEVNRRRGMIAELDIFGQLEETYEPELKTLLNESGGAVRYRGSVPCEESVVTLKSYFVHLFPTTWHEEGMPGTLVDCFAAGLPTIATDWNYNAEILTEGRTGFCYDWKTPDRLTERMLYAIDHSPEIYQMRFACIAEAGKYTPDVVMQDILLKMGVQPNEKSSDSSS